MIDTCASIMRTNYNSIILNHEREYNIMRDERFARNKYYISLYFKQTEYDKIDKKYESGFYVHTAYGDVPDAALNIASTNVWKGPNTPPVKERVGLTRQNVLSWLASHTVVPGGSLVYCYGHTGACGLSDLKSNMCTRCSPGYGMCTPPLYGIPDIPDICNQKLSVNLFNESIAAEKKAVDDAIEANRVDWENKKNAKPVIISEVIGVKCCQNISISDLSATNVTIDNIKATCYVNK